MTTENRYNLIDEPWIPIVDVGKVSLRQLFSQPAYRALGGNPVQKIALTKLLLAIAQSAYTPEDDEDWTALGADGLAQKCQAYIEQWHDRFYLYGDKPFLQMPAIKAAAIQPFGAVLAEISTGNTTVLMQSQVEKALTEADKTLLIVQLMGFGLGGKKTDNSVVLTPNYQNKMNDKGKPSTGKPSASIGFLGFLHNFLQGKSLWETIWLNLFTSQQIADLSMYPQGLGTAPWEQMPTGEDDGIAQALKFSLMGRLVPLSRFCLLAENGLHYSEGIAHAGYKEGVTDPSVSVDFTAKDPKAIWVDPEKRPWRLLTALLSFFAHTSNKGFDCYQLRLNMGRAIHRMPAISIWSGGLRVSSNAGEQYVSGSDDFVESVIQLNSHILGERWFANLQLEMDELDKLSKTVYGATLNYFKSQNMETKEQAAQASNLFWQLCERQFQNLLDACDDAELARTMRPVFAQFVHKAYNTYCINDTARQLDAWAKNRPNLAKYLHNPSKELA
jgi:CRISPR system Cascade subunit CasA